LVLHPFEALDWDRSDLALTRGEPSQRFDAGLLQEPAVVLEKIGDEDE